MKALVLAGGESSRMGTDKALLKIEGITLTERLYRELLSAGLSEVFISAREISSVQALGLRTLIDDDFYQGPAAGLLRAYREDPETDWLIVACDFPFALARDFAWLINRHLKNENVDVTCYSHTNSQPEPLFAIWSPNALQRLKTNYATGLTGPSQTLITSEAQLLRPRSERVLVNTNTPQEWTNVST